MKIFTTMTRVALVGIIFLCSQNLFAQWNPTSSNASNYFNTAGGNIGIGTGNISLSERLTINGNLMMGPFGSSLTYYSILTSPGSSLINNGNGRNLVVSAGSSDNQAGKKGGGLYLRPGVPVSPATEYGDVILGDLGGNVGIGTETPSDRLTIRNGAIRLSNPGQSIINFSGSNYVDIGYVGWYDNDLSLRVWNKDNSNIILGTNNLPRFYINSSGQVGIGTNNMPTGHLLYVAGSAIAEQMVVKLRGSWPDYTFESSYNLRPLSQVESYIKENKHLPEIPSAIEVKANGINLGEMDALLLKKIEELTLYTIELNKRIDELEKEKKQQQN
jgi:hypothetical protein